MGLFGKAGWPLNLCRILAPGRRHSTPAGHNIAYLSRWSSSLISSQLQSCASLLRASYPDLRGYHFEPCPWPADEGIIGLPVRFLPCGWGDFASERTPHLYGWLLAPVPPVKAAREEGLLKPPRIGDTPIPENLLYLLALGRRVINSPVFPARKIRFC